MRVLIVEDEFLIATGLAAVLQDAGCEIIGMAASVPKSLRLLALSGGDAAVLDANLAGVSSEPVAAALRQSDIPFIVLSGYAQGQLSGALADAPYLAKPCKGTDLVAAVFAQRRGA